MLLPALPGVFQEPGLSQSTCLNIHVNKHVFRSGNTVHFYYMCFWKFIIRAASKCTRNVLLDGRTKTRLFGHTISLYFKYSIVARMGACSFKTSPYKNNLLPFIRASWLLRGSRNSLFFLNQTVHRARDWWRNKCEDNIWKTNQQGNTGNCITRSSTLCSLHSSVRAITLKDMRSVVHVERMGGIKIDTNFQL